MHSQVRRVWLNDLDPLVYAFWRVAAFDTYWLIEAMHSEPVTVRRWEHHRASSPRTLRDRALKCLFLNRTTFSGILHRAAGPIGGKSQESAYKINCRFNKPQLEQRILLVGALAAAGRIVNVTCQDYEVLIRRLKKDVHISADSVFIYLDPPYVEKAKNLYEWSFAGGSEHDRLLNVLASIQWRWVLSYDDHPEVRARYNGILTWRKRTQKTTTFLVPNRYSAASAQKRTTPYELVVTNLPNVPIKRGWKRI
jgi:DNA adenine methylase